VNLGVRLPRLLTEIRDELRRDPTIGLVALSVALFFLISFTAPGLAHELLERSMGRPEADSPSLTGEQKARVAHGLTWVLWPLSILLIAALASKKVVVALGAGALIAYLFYLLGSMPGELKGIAETDGWPSPEQAGFATALAGQVVAIVVAMCLILLAWRGDWSTFAVGVVGSLAAAAIVLGFWSALKQPFETVDEKLSEISLEATVIGAPLAAKDSVNVVFVIPKRNDEGTVTSVEQTTRAATAAAPAECTAADAPACTVKVLVKRGDKDESLGPWLADREAAIEVWVIGPTGVPPSPTP
jgi:hypothetical protein